MPIRGGEGLIPTANMNKGFHDTTMDIKDVAKTDI